MACGGFIAGPFVAGCLVGSSKGRTDRIRASSGPVDQPGPHSGFGFDPIDLVGVEEY